MEIDILFYYIGIFIWLFFILRLLYKITNALETLVLTHKDLLITIQEKEKHKLIKNLSEKEIEQFLKTNKNI